jgi:hypothetical protein
VLVLLASTGVARADVNEQCTADRARGAALRQSGDASGALYAFRACSAPECSDEVRDACTAAYDAVQSSMPSLVVSIRDARGAVADAHVVIDGRDATATRGAFIVDPGQHTVRVDGIEGVEQHVTVSAGDHKKLVFQSTAIAHAPLASSAAWPWLVTSAGTTGVVVGAVLTAVGYAMFQSCDFASCRQYPTYTDINHAGIGVVIGSSIVTAAGVVWLLLKPHHAKTLALAPNVLTF